MHSPSIAYLTALLVLNSPQDCHQSPLVPASPSVVGDRAEDLKISDRELLRGVVVNLTPIGFGYIDHITIRPSTTYA